MFAEQLRRAVEGSPRAQLPVVSALLWKAYAAGTVSESDAADLSNLIEARKALPAPQKPVQRRLALGLERKTPAWSAVAAGLRPVPYGLLWRAGSHWPSKPSWP